jgi:rubrerythrin
MIERVFKSRRWVMAKDEKKGKHEKPIKMGDKYICPHCQTEVPVKQDCPVCKLEIDWTKI